MKNKLILCLVPLTAMIFLLGSCNKKKEDPATPANQTLINQLDLWGDSLTTNNLIDSVNLSVQGALFYVYDPVTGLDYTRTFGTSDISSARYLPLKASDIFRIGTITNTFTTTVFLQLVQDGALSLDDHLSTFFPDILNSENITLRQVANMTSGLYDFTETDTIHKIWSGHPLSVLTPQQLVGFAMAYPPYFQPGAGCRYSHTNSVLLGLIIERVTEEALSEAYRKRILEPLSISNTTFPKNQFMPFYASCSHGYEYSDSLHYLSDVTERYNPSWAWGSGNLISDLPDLKAWLQVLVNGSLLNSDVQQERMKMTDWQTVHGIPLQYGLGIIGTSGYFGHTGDIQGYHTICMYSPSTGATIIVMVNNGSASPLLMFASIANLLSPGLIPVTR
jgi:D-alanyl-D-alanine carboxypeptidase